PRRAGRRRRRSDPGRTATAGEGQPGDAGLGASQTAHADSCHPRTATRVAPPGRRARRGGQEVGPAEADADAAAASAVALVRPGLPARSGAPPGAGARVRAEATRGLSRETTSGRLDRVRERADALD